MNKAKKKFILYAMLAIFVMLTLLLGVINGVNFTMAAEDADRITRMISDGNGQFGIQPGRSPGAAFPQETPDQNGNPQAPDQNGNPQAPDQSGNPPEIPGRQGTPPGSSGQNGAPPVNGQENAQPFGGFNGLGPDSPELAATVRYFTVEFNGKGEGKLKNYEISAVDEAEALSWAQSLLERPAVGWTRTVYRYRVVTEGGKTAVIVIDQGRELLPSYRLLLISVVGGIAGLLVSFLVLIFVSKKVFAPLEEADRKQKHFISEMERQFKVPLTVISADTACLERETGASDYTGSINRQVKKMTALVKDLGSLAIYKDDTAPSETDLSAALTAALDAEEAAFREKGIALRSEIAPDVRLKADAQTVRSICWELAANAVKFAQTRADFRLTQENGRILLTASNDAPLPDGGADQALDRFVRLSNAEGIPGEGLGLAGIRETVLSLGGRISADVKSGVFTVRISL